MQLCTALQRLATSESCTEDTAINCRTIIHSLKTITQCTFCIDDDRQSDKPETYVQLVVGGKLSLVVDMEQLFDCGPLCPLVHCAALAPSWTPCQSLVLQCIHTVIQVCASAGKDCSKACCPKTCLCTFAPES